MKEPHLDVAIVVLRREGMVLVRRRTEREHLGGRWEFPGGKVRPGEPPIVAAAREAREEVSVEAVDLEAREVIEHDYSDRSVRIHVFEGACRGAPRAPDGAEWRWAETGELAVLSMPEANRALVRRLTAESIADPGRAPSAAAEGPPRSPSQDLGGRIGSLDSEASLDSSTSPFASMDQLLADWRVLAPAPPDRGWVAWIVSRPAEGGREIPERVRLELDAGVPGDRWRLANDPERLMQITAMQIDVAKLMAAGRPLSLFGDNLFLDLDLSSENLPPGSRVRVGTAVLEVTAKPHTGCVKFRARFGDGALRFTAKLDLRPRNLRGVHLRVALAGDVEIGDPVEVVARARTHL